MMSEQHLGGYGEQEDWRDLPRSEMLDRVIVAVDGAKAGATENGEEDYVRYVERVLFPWLEAELEKAAREEGRSDEYAAFRKQNGMERPMDEWVRRLRLLDGAENIAAELERLRMLREFELGVRVEDVEGSLCVRPVEDE